MVHEPRISVIIPAYNRKDALNAAIKSVLAQSYPPDEIVIIDDASTDGTDPHFFPNNHVPISYFRLPANRGASFARNFGADQARGDYVAFLDSDDLWVADKLERQIPVLRGPSEKFFLCSNATLVGPEPPRRLYNPSPPGPDQEISDYFLMDGCTFQTSTLVVPTILARRIRFDESLRRHQDWDFVLRCIADGAKYFYDHVPTVLYRYEPADPHRISHSIRPEPTLEWFSSSSLLPTRAKGYHYCARYFLDHLRDSPLAAVNTLSRLVLFHPSSASAVVGGAIRRVTRGKRK